MKRRTLLQTLAATSAWLRLAPASLAQTPALAPDDEAQLRALADVVLPGEPGISRPAVVDDFLRWIRNYREGAELEHGYGFPRLRKSAPSPAARYPAQLAALERAARARGGSFATLDLAARRAIVEAAVAAAKVDRLPARPTGDHIATDLMAFYFHSPAAEDVAYRAPIGRNQCRGLPGSGVRPGSEEGRRRVRPGSDPGNGSTQLGGMNGARHDL